jgi:hypothetical protein
MNGKNTPTYDPADVIIARTLKGWVSYPQIPRWARARLLSSASQSAVKVSSMFVLRMVFKWVLLRGIEMLSLLINDNQMTFVPSSESYSLNPPHLSPCAVQSRVRDTFLLEAGMLGAI